MKGCIFTTQIIESKRLERRKDGLGLGDLRGGLQGSELWEILERSGRMPKGAPLSAFLRILLEANKHGLREMEMSEAVELSDELEEILEELGVTAKWEAKGLEKGLEQAVRRLQKYGMEPTRIAEVLELPLGTVIRYLEAE
jgi:hypothetical protein